MSTPVNARLLWPRWQRSLAAPLLLGGLALALGAHLGVPGAAAYLMTMWACALLGLGLSVIGFGLQLPSNQVFNRRLYAAAVVLVLPGTAVAIHVLGMRQFGGFDHSIVIEAGWRMVQGQRLPVDYPNTTPPGFLLGPYWAFQLGGVSWQSLVDGFALFSLVAMAWSLALWRVLLGRSWMALGLTFMMGAMASMPVSYWWYNPLTSTAGIVFALASAVALRRPELLLTWVSWAAAAVLLGCAKPNVAGLLGVPVAMLLLTRRTHWRPALLATLAAAVAFETLLRLNGMRFIDFMRGYGEVATVGMKLGMFFVDPSAFEVLVSVTGLALMLLPLPALLCRTRDRRMALLGVATVAAGLVAFISAGETKVVDLIIVYTGLVLCGVAAGVLPALDMGVTWPAMLGRYMVVAATVASMMGLGVAVTRHRVQGIGYGRFFEHDLRPEPFHEGFFHGLQASQRLFNVHADVARALTENPHGPVYFGPRMQWAYAAFRQGSPDGQPLWWHPGVAFALSRQQGFLEDLLSGRFELMIFLKDDYTYLPPDFAARLLQRYERMPGFATLDVYRRKLKS